MKKRFLVMLMIAQLAFVTKTFTQNVSINTTGNAADTSAMLDITSGSKGILIPRMNLLQRSAIFMPADGLLVYQTNGSKGFYYYDSIAGWTNLASATDTWLLAGNTATNPAANFIGTTDSSSLSIRTDSIERIFINGNTGNIGINTNTPASAVDINGSVSHTVTTAPGSISLTSANYTVVLTGASGSIVTLPSAASSTGRVYVLVNRTAAKNTSPDYQTFTLGVSSPVIAGNSSITLQSDGVNWNRIQ